MRKVFFSLIGLCFIAAACNNSGQDAAEQRTNGYSATTLKTKEDSLMHDVMEGHDAGMAKMGSLIGTQKQVQKVLDSLAKLPAKAKKAAASYEEALDSSLHQLKTAEDNMEAWMQGFNMDSAKNNKDLRIQYLQSEKEKVAKVKEDILESLQKADSLLKKD